MILEVYSRNTVITMENFINLFHDSQNFSKNRKFPQHFLEILQDMSFLGESTLDTAYVGEI